MSSNKKQAVEIKDKQGGSLRISQEENLIPQPVIMEGYKKLDPRFIDFFLEHAQKEQAFRHRLEDEKIKEYGRSGIRSFRLNVLGLVLGFLLILSLLVAGVYLVVSGVNGWSLGFGLVSLIGSFLLIVRMLVRLQSKSKNE